MEKDNSSNGIKSKQKWLDIAEIIDSHRIIPRLLLAGVCVLVVYTMTWFFGIEMIAITSCDSALIQILLDNGHSLELAKELACNVTGFTGGPTTQHVTFATAIVGGLASAVFGFYTNTGRKWKKKEED